MIKRLTPLKIVRAVKFRAEMQLIRPLVKKLVCFFPIDSKKIVFSNFAGRGFADNPKYIANKLIEQEQDLHYVWIVSDMNSSMPNHIKKVKHGSFRAYYEWATAKIWVDNIRNTDRPRKKNEQIYLQTWHGPYSIKQVEKDAEDKLSKRYIEKVKYDGSITDAILASSYLHELQYKRAFYLSEKTEILKYGLPRNDALFKKSTLEELKSKYGYSGSDYLILYAPTFRDDGSIKGYDLDLKATLQAFETLTKQNCKMIVRLHPNVNPMEVNIGYNNIKVFNGNLIDDMQELAIMCDMLISDYSSTVFDFALLRKPALLFCNDFREYKEKRGIMPEFDMLPFPLAKNNLELQKTILEFDFAVYQLRLDAFHHNYPYYDDGHASELVAAWITSKMKINESYKA